MQLLSIPNFRDASDIVLAPLLPLHVHVDTCMRVCMLVLVLVLETSDGKEKACLKNWIGVTC